MPPFVQRTMDRLKELWTKTNLSARLFIGAMAVAVIGAFFIMIWMINRPDFQVLYSKMAPEDASKVVEMLKSEKVDYKLEDNGATVLVPGEMVYDLRLKVAGEGNLVGQGVGFEIFDEIKVGQTEFVQKINYQRALQGELSRTITEFPEIERARVHLVIPDKSLFIEDQMEASASVVLKLLEGKKLEDKQIQSIINLVSMAVEGLDKGKITVTDTQGRILHIPKDDSFMEGLTTTQYEYKVGLQDDMEKRIEQMLFPVIGPGKVIARVNTDLDFSRKTIHKELYDPDSAVVRSEQRSEETQQGRANIEGGVPEANFRGDGIGGGLSTQTGTRETRTTNFEINKEEQEIVAPLGEIDRLSAAVIVDGTYELNEDTGEYTFIPRSEEELDRIEQLVQNALGFDSARGDSIEVTTISFGGPEAEEEPSLFYTMMEYAMRLGKPLLNALLIFLFLILVVRPVVMALIRPKVEHEMVEGLVGLPAGEERLALIEADEDEADALDALKKIEDIKAHALQMSEQNMEQAVNILRNWLKEPQEERKSARAA